MDNSLKESEPNANSISEENLDIDEVRLRRSAEFYAKCLSEVREWLAECLGDVHVPPAYDLEEDIRSGVLLARLANYFLPESVQLDKVFDLDTSRLHDQGLQYRHTDNILKWRRACESVGVMSILLPEPVDVYAGKNIRTIFAIIALANRLHSVGKAPPLRDQSDFILADADYEALRDRIAAASEIEGIDWEIIQRDHQKVEVVYIEERSAIEISSNIEASSAIEISDNSLASLRHLCKDSDVPDALYGGDFLVENQKEELSQVSENDLKERPTKLPAEKKESLLSHASKNLMKILRLTCCVVRI